MPGIADKFTQSAQKQTAVAGHDEMTSDGAIGDQGSARSSRPRVSSPARSIAPYMLA
jgi:hypothetical protein